METTADTSAAGAGSGAGAGGVASGAAVLTHPETTVKANITQGEAEARAAVIGDITYRLHLDLTDGDNYAGWCEVGFSHSTPGKASTFLDFTGLRITELTVNGAACLDAEWKDHRLTLPATSLQAVNTVRVVFENAYDHTGAGLHTFTDPEDNEVYVYTNFEPYEAHRMLPCFDQPDLKAKYTFSATAPERWVVVANSVATKAGQAIDDGRKAWEYAPTPLLSTYLYAVVAGPYVSFTDTFGKVPLGLFARKSLEKQLADHKDELFTITKQGLAYYEEYFAMPYPFTKYDQLFVPEFNEGAMENAGAVTFTENLLPRDAVTDGFRAQRADTVLHEMAHMYFGDTTTCKWWDGLWLNESFATYMAARCVAEATRFGDVSWVFFNARMKNWAFSEDQRPTTHPINSDVADSDSCFSLFDGVTYGKGASVLQQLNFLIGKDRFRDGMRLYFERHSWGVTTVDDFLSALQARAGDSDVDLKEWSRKWLYTAGLNSVRPEFTVGEDGTISSFKIHQSAPEKYPTLRVHQMEVAFFNDAGEVTVKTVRTEPAAVTEVPAFVGLPKPAAVYLNWNDQAFVKVRMDEASLAKIGDFVTPDVIPSVLNRGLLWSTFYDMTRDAELPATKYLEMARTKLPADGSATILRTVLARRVTAAVGSLIPVTMYPAVAAAWFATAAAALAAASTDDTKLCWSQFLSSCAGATKDTAAEFVRMVDTEGADGTYKFDQPLRWRAAALVAEYGLGDVAARIDAELKRDSSDRGKRCAETARVARNDAGVKAEAFTRFSELSSDGKSRHTERAAMGGFWRRSQRELLAPYADKFFDVIQPVFKHQKRENAHDFFDYMSPPAGDDDSMVKRMQALLDSLPEDADKTLRKSIVQTIDSYERQVRCRRLCLADTGARL